MPRINVTALIFLLMVGSSLACTRAQIVADDGGTEVAAAGTGGDSGLLPDEAVQEDVAPADEGEDDQGGGGQGTGGEGDGGGQSGDAGGAGGAGADVAPGSGGADVAPGSGGSATGGSGDAMVVDAAMESEDTSPGIDAPGEIPCLNDAATESDGNNGCAATFRVIRLGDGNATLSSAATAVFVDEHQLDGTLVGTIAMPTATAGNNHPLVLSGAATSEGGLALSADGKFLTLAGYAAAPGTGSIASSPAAIAPRVVGRIDSSGVVDTSTVVATAFDGNNVRSATSTDGTGFWVAGSSNSTGGIWFVAFGTSGGVRVLANPNAVRIVNVSAGQLYGSSNAGIFADVFAVGNGLPTSEGQVGTPLTGMPASGPPSPFAFVFFDRSTAVAGLDTVYVADDRAPPAGGVQKWVSDGTTWTLKTAFTVSQNPAGFRGLTGFLSPGGVTLIATTAEPAFNRIVVFFDDDTSTPSTAVVATAKANTVLRGVALSPGLR